jgi:hypothetical protein
MLAKAWSSDETTEYFERPTPLTRLASRSSSCRHQHKQGGTEQAAESRDEEVGQKLANVVAKAV